MKDFFTFTSSLYHVLALIKFGTNNTYVSSSENYSLLNNNYQGCNNLFLAVFKGINKSQLSECENINSILAELKISNENIFLIENKVVPSQIFKIDLLSLIDLRSKLGEKFYLLNNAQIDILIKSSKEMFWDDKDGFKDSAMIEKLNNIALSPKLFDLIEVNNQLR